MHCHFNEYHSPKCFILNAVALSVIILIVVILSVDMMNVIMISVVLLIVVAPALAFSYKLGQFNGTGLVAQCYKAFYGRNLRMFVLSWNAFPHQVFPVKSTFCK
jgi:hypothetical protein